MRQLCGNPGQLIRRPEIATDNPRPFLWADKTKTLAEPQALQAPNRKETMNTNQPGTPPFLYHTIFYLSIIFFTLPAMALEFAGEVVSVADGDTVTILETVGAQRKQWRVRLHGIDAPEKSQAFGDKARQHLAALVFRKQVTVTVRDVDKYGRLVAEVVSDKINVNLAMLSAGLAWHYKRYDNSPEYAQAETDARSKKIGIWSDADAVPPWDFRRR